MAKQKAKEPSFWVVEDLPIGDPLRKAVEEFQKLLSPIEGLSRLLVLCDECTKALYCECHLQASVFVPLSTVDVPLDPNKQVGYRANREVVEDHDANKKMREDAKNRRSFSNIVAEFTTKFDPSHPLKVVGGQHRFLAIKEALDQGIDEYHGFKVYFQLTKPQRLDAQLISNTTIAISKDLLDRMQETYRGPSLRQWAQQTGFLAAGEDFSDRRSRARPVSVQFIRTFIVNYLLGIKVPSDSFNIVDTTPVICPAGKPSSEWEEALKSLSTHLQDKPMKEAAVAFTALVAAQRRMVLAWTPPGSADYAEKGFHLAVMAGWAFVAGVLQPNDVRLKRHYDLKDGSTRDPLNADAIGKGRHKSDPSSYRGLGFRMNAKECGRFAELFYLQTERGEGITPRLVDAAIKNYHAKHAVLDAARAKAEM